MKIEKIIKDLGDGRYEAVIDTRIDISPNPVFQVVIDNTWGYYDIKLKERAYLLKAGTEVKLMDCNLRGDVGLFQINGVMNVWIAAKNLKKISGNLGLRVISESPEKGIN